MGGWVQAYPDEDTLLIPSAPNFPSGYLLDYTVQMKLNGESL